LPPWIEGLPRRQLFWLALGGITFLALMPWTQEMPKPFQWSDKLNHFSAFVVLAVLLMNAYRMARIAGVAWLTLYGALIEGIQSFLPWRSAEWADLGVDFLAAGTGVLVWTLLVRYRIFPGPERFRR
jgi:VanZ family protein